MGKFRVTFTLVLACALHQFGESADPSFSFSYDPNGSNGPRHWANQYPECGKNRQSPINIEVNRLNRGLFSTQLRLEGLDIHFKKAEVANQGLTAKCKPLYEDQKPHLVGGPLGNAYLFDSAHFHWGVSDTDGSEHAINGQKYPLEAHFVFHNKAYQNATYALSFPDGYAVIGVLFKVERDSPDLKIFDKVKNATKEGDTYQVDAQDFSLREIIPKNFIYAYYKGSFTTPPCLQIVDWFVSMNIKTINSAQLKALREFQDSHQRPISNNFRDLQWLNGRRLLMGLSKT